MEDPLIPARGHKERRGGWLEKVLDVEEAKTQVMFAIPMVLTNVSYYAIPLVSVMFAGHLGNVELAGASLANSWATVTGFALMIGLSGALETFCGQNYGAKTYRMLGIHLQASIFIALFFSILVSILWTYTEPILILLHQDPDISKMAKIYLKHLIPGIFAYAILQCLLRFIQTQRVVMPLVVCSLLPLLVHIALTRVLIHECGMGFKGAPLSAAISLWISLVMLSLYVKFSERFRETWQGLSMECFSHLIPNMKLALPSAAMVCLEYWAFETLVLLAGLMPNSQNSTSLVAMCLTTVTVIYNISFGLSAAVSTRVSNELGAGNSEKAKNAVAVTLKLGLSTVIVIVLLMTFGHDIWARSFSGNSDIIEEFASMTPLLAISFLFDSMQACLSGVARGCGLQHLAVWINLGSFYAVGMVLAIFLGFVLKLHVKGLWGGMLCGLLTQASILLVITLRIKWDKLDLYVEDEKRVLR